jgi:ABC-2 type transport system ATP-binding protein
MDARRSRLLLAAMRGNGSRGRPNPGLSGPGSLSLTKGRRLRILNSVFGGCDQAWSHRRRGAAHKEEYVATAVRTEALTKQFINPSTGGLVTAVSDLNIEVERNEIFGFLGRNGAGKTTTIKMLLGLIFPTTGSGEILGRPLGDNEVKKRISLLPEEPYFYDHLAGPEVLDFYARIFHLPTAVRIQRIPELMARVGLKDVGRKRLSQYSKGMRQRIGIAQALINDPDVLFFDEPTSGLDPIAHDEILDLIISIREKGKTMFLCSHQLPDVERVCDRVAIIDRGKMQVQGKIDDLLSTPDTRIEFMGLPEGEAMAKVTAAAVNHSMVDGVLQASVKGEDVDGLIGYARSQGAKIVSVMPHRRTLSELFRETVSRSGDSEVVS